MIMIKNYLKIALRNLVRFKGYTFLNIIGLVIGISACMILLRYVHEEFSYDQHHFHKENIYRVDSEFIINGNHNKSGQTPSPLAKAMQADLPEVLESTRIYSAGNEQLLIAHEDNSFFEERVTFADSNFFEVLTYEFMAGDRATALDQPFSVVLSDRMASKLFDSQNGIGKTITIGSSYGEEKYQVTGVFDSQKYHSHIASEVYVAGNSGQIGDNFFDLQEWGAMNMYYTYVRLQAGTNIEQFTTHLNKWISGYVGNRLKEFGVERIQYLTNVQDIYLQGEGENWHGKTGNSRFVYLIFFIGILILFFACINFINLATAKAGLRSKEVGVRKVVGAGRGMLFKQFITEAFMYVLIAVLIAVGVVKLCLPIFNRLMDTELTLAIWQEPHLFLYLAGFIILTTLVAGSYPAFYLSSFSPSRIFSNHFSNNFSTKKIRSGLVIFQFIITIALIQGVLVIHQQMDFIRNKDLGFNEKAKMLISLNTNEAYENSVPFRNELLKHPQVLEVGATSHYPGGYNGSTFMYTKEGQRKGEGFMCINHTTTPEYMQLMSFELLAGRLFDPNRLADTNSTVVITEAAMKGIGFDLDNAIGQDITLNWEENQTFKVIGVIKDYHAQSLHEEIEGQIYDWSPAWPTKYVMASIDPQNLPTLLSQLESTWEQFNPKEPFEFQFLEDRLQENYLAEQQMSQLVQWGTGLAILICCLGLLGLIGFAADRRAKEISIRKILGASVPNIITLLSKEFILLVLIAFVIAAPISWYLMTQWLNDFAYHITMPWWAFLLSAIVAIGITVLTIAFQSVKAAVGNPVDTLRNE